MIIVAIISGIILSLLAIYILRVPFTNKKKKHITFVIACMLFLSGITGVAFTCFPFDSTRGALEVLSMEQNDLQERLKGQPFTDFCGTTIDGLSVSLSDYVGKGNFVLIDFWASWCGPCKATLPILRSANEKYGKYGLCIISVNCWDKIEEAIKEVKKGKMTWHVIIPETNSATSFYHISSIPTCFLINPDGIIVESGFHPNYLPEILNNYINNE